MCRRAHRSRRAACKLGCRGSTAGQRCNGMAPDLVLTGHPGRSQPYKMERFALAPLSCMSLTWLWRTHHLPCAAQHLQPWCTTRSVSQGTCHNHAPVFVKPHRPQRRRDFLETCAACAVDTTLGLQLPCCHGTCAVCASPACRRVPSGKNALGTRAVHTLHIGSLSRARSCMHVHAALRRMLSH